MTKTQQKHALFFIILLISAGLFWKFKLEKKFKKKTNINAKQMLGEDFHLGIIMDGNRRWAKQHGLPTISGHKEGANIAKEVIEYCSKAGVSTLTLYVFSLENFARNTQEKTDLFNLIPSTLDEWQNFLEESNIKIKVCGDKQSFPEQSLASIKKSEEITEKHSGMLLQMLFCYGGKQEILSAVSKLYAELQNTQKTENIEISESMLRKFFWTEDIPDPHLIIRTGKRNRISNFMTWQSAYTDLMFLDILWPEVNTQIIEDCLHKYKKVIKTFGK